MLKRARTLEFLTKGFFHFLKTTLALIAFTTLIGCQSDKKITRFLLAEKFWNKGEYSAAVTEFDKVVRLDPQGKTGKDALYRAATTEVYFLSRFTSAVERFERLTAMAANPTEAWEFQKWIATVYFDFMHDYSKAETQLRKLLDSSPPTKEEKLELDWKLGKSLFFEQKFPESYEVFDRIFKTEYAPSEMKSKALFEKAMTLLTEGDPPLSEPVLKPMKGAKGAKGKSQSKFQKAIDLFEEYKKLTGLKSYDRAEADFWIGHCYEELEKLDLAVDYYQKVLTTHRSPVLVQLRIQRVLERKNQKAGQK